jgi:hypothetical protein
MTCNNKEVPSVSNVDIEVSEETMEDLKTVMHNYLRRFIDPVSLALYVGGMEDVTEFQHLHSLTGKTLTNHMMISIIEEAIIKHTTREYAESTEVQLDLFGEKNDK